MIKKLSISGLRGFGQLQSIDFSVPDMEKDGSGLTIITGANNAGKTTIVESLRAFNGKDSPSFSEGKRNQLVSEKIDLELIDDMDKKYTITSLPGGGSSTQKNTKFQGNFYIVPSRRTFSADFAKNVLNIDRDTFISYYQNFEPNRTSSLNHFESRIFQIEKNKDSFNNIARKILGNDFQWTIEQRESGYYYIKYINDGISHSNEGIGDGIWSIFTICAAFFDSLTKDVIIIDEPELSLHPTLQKRLMNLLLEYSKTRQIIVCTHSPYFISWEAIVNGANLIRVVKEKGGSTCYEISEPSRKTFRGLLKDLNNPHILGLEANEAFFLEDSIILVEGQEDVIIYKKIAMELNLQFKGTFFGWGVGGAHKMESFLGLFQDLGYKKVVAILDGDKKQDAKKLQDNYPNYTIISLETNDIRDKPEKSLDNKVGITDTKGKLKEEYREYALELIEKINSAL